MGVRLRLGSVGLKADAVAASTKIFRAIVSKRLMILPAVSAARSCLRQAHGSDKAAYAHLLLLPLHSVRGLSAAVG
jgi:hypothetical protein